MLSFEENCKWEHAKVWDYYKSYKNEEKRPLFSNRSFLPPLSFHLNVIHKVLMNTKKKRNSSLKEVRQKQTED